MDTDTVVAGRWDMVTDGHTIMVIMEVAIGLVIMPDITMDTIMVTTTVIGDILHTVMVAMADTADTVDIMAEVAIMITLPDQLLFMGLEVQVEQEPLFHDRVVQDVQQARIITKKADPSLLETEVVRLQEDQVKSIILVQAELQQLMPN